MAKILYELKMKKFNNRNSGKNYVRPSLACKKKMKKKGNENEAPDRSKVISNARANLGKIFQ